MVVCLLPLPPLDSFQRMQEDTRRCDHFSRGSASLLWIEFLPLMTRPSPLTLQHGAAPGLEQIDSPGRSEMSTPPDKKKAFQQRLEWMVSLSFLPEIWKK